MCIVREKCLSIDDLAFLIGSNVLACEPDEEAIQRSVAIHERAPAWQRSAQRLPASWNRSRTSAVLIDRDSAVCSTPSGIMESVTF